MRANRRRSDIPLFISIRVLKSVALVTHGLFAVLGCRPSKLLGVDLLALHKRTQTTADAFKQGRFFCLQNKATLLRYSENSDSR